MPSSRRLTALIATAGAACALGAPAASQAAPIYEVTYKVGFEATIDYEHIYADDDNPLDARRAEVSAPMKITGEIDPVTFRNGKLLVDNPWGTAEYESTGGGALLTHDIWNTLEQKMDHRSTACFAGSGVHGGSVVIGHDPDAPPIAGTQRMRVRFAEDVYAFFNCTGDAGSLEGIDLANPYQMPMGEGILDGDFDLPNEAIGMGTIIQHVNAPVAHRSPQYCPGKHHLTESCTYNWQGKLTFTKTEEYQYGIENLPPGYGQPQQGTQQAQQPQSQQPTGDDDDLIVPLVPTAPTTARLVGNRLTFPVTCPAGCIGVAKVGAVKQKFTVAKTAKKVTLKLSAKARKALKKAGKPKVGLTLTPKGGGAPVRATVRVKRA